MKETVIKGLNTVLMWNFFFVLMSFAWFAIALIGHSFNINLGLNVWYRFWDPLFMPAIGILMAGAILSGLMGWITRKLDTISDRA